MLRALLFLFILQSAPEVRAAIPASTGTATGVAVSSAAPGGVAASEFQALKELVRQDQNAVRRARYALRRAQQRSDAGASAQAEKRLQEAKESLKRHRSRMRELMGPKPSRKDPKAPRKPAVPEKPGG